MSEHESYTYQAPMEGMPQRWGTLVRASDGAFIPADPANMDFQQYLTWTKTNPAPAGAPTAKDFP
jgi:hypothetical protein